MDLLLLNHLGKQNIGIRSMQRDRVAVILQVRLPLKGWVWGSTCLLKGEYLPCFLLHEAGIWDNFPIWYLLLRHLALWLQLGLELGRSFLKALGRGEGMKDMTLTENSYFLLLYSRIQPSIAYALNIYPMDWTRCFLFHKLFLWQILDILYFDYKCLRLFSKKKKISMLEIRCQLAYIWG